MVEWLTPCLYVLQLVMLFKYRQRSWPIVNRLLTTTADATSLQVNALAFLKFSVLTVIFLKILFTEIEDGPYNISVAIEKRLSWVDEKRKLGNHLYSQNMLEGAKHAYTKCNRVLRQGKL